MLSGTQSSEFYVNVCYNLQPVENERTLCVQWNSIFFSDRQCKVFWSHTLLKTLYRKALFWVSDWSQRELKPMTPVNSNLHKIFKQKSPLEKVGLKILPNSE